MNKYKVIVGIEFEAEYNPQILGQLSENIHHAKNGWCKFLDNNYFKCEEDGSLRTQKFTDTVEIISIPIELNKIKTILKSFQQSIFNKVGKQIAFNQIFNMNKTCGCHVHISILNCDTKYRYEIYDNTREEVFDFIGQPYDIKDALSDDFMDIFRTKLHKKIKQTLKSVYPSFNKYYFRKFAQDKNITDTRLDPRYIEYYYHNDERCEYRSFNLIGVKTWNEFFKMFDIFKTTLHKTLKLSINTKNNTIHSARIKNGR